MGDLRCPFLEGGVHETEVWVVLGLRGHARPDEVLDGHLDGLHVNAAGEVKVLVQEITCRVSAIRDGAVSPFERACVFLVLELVAHCETDYAVGYSETSSAATSTVKLSPIISSHRTQMRSSISGDVRRFFRHKRTE